MRRRGFTFVELLVTISIIGILATLTVLRISQNKLKANFAGVKANVNTFGKSIETYKSEYDGVIGAATSSANSTVTLQGSPPEGSTVFQKIFSGTKSNVAGSSSYEAKLQKTPSTNFVYVYGSANYIGELLVSPFGGNFGPQTEQTMDANCYYMYSYYFDPGAGTTTTITAMMNDSTQDTNPAYCRL